MEIITADEFKTRFEDILKGVNEGFDFEIASENKKEIIGYFLLPLQFTKPRVGHIRRYSNG